MRAQKCPSDSVRGHLGSRPRRLMLAIINVVAEQATCCAEEYTGSQDSRCNPLDCDLVVGNDGSEHAAIHQTTMQASQQRMNGKAQAAGEDGGAADCCPQHREEAG